MHRLCQIKLSSALEKVFLSPLSSKLLSKNQQDQANFDMIPKLKKYYIQNSFKISVALNYI